MISGSTTNAFQQVPRYFLIVALFIQGWFLILHFWLAEHADPSVRVLGRAFDLTREGTFPTFWSCLQAMIIAVAAFVIAWTLQSPSAKRRLRLAWQGIGVLFTLIALDDAAGIHERVSAITAMSLMDRLAYPSYPWHVLLAPFLVIGLLMSAGVLLVEIKECVAKRAALGLGLLCFAAAIVMDFAEGLGVMAELTEASHDTVSSTDKAVEEMLELIGTTMFAFVTLSLLVGRLDGLVVRLPANESEQADDHQGLEEKEVHGIVDRQMQPDGDRESESAAFLEP